MRFLEPEIITPIKLVIKNNITNELQVAWFTTLDEANAAMSKIEQSGTLGNDYWIQNTPRGAENVVKFKDESVVPGAVYLQDTLHPTVSSSTVRFYVADNESGVNAVHTKLLRIDYLCELYGMTKVSVYSINPQNDMIQKADMTAYLNGNLANMEADIIKHYVQIYIMSAAGPMVDLKNNENPVPEEHHHHHEEEPEKKEEVTGFRISTKQQEEKKEEPAKEAEQKPAVEEDDEDEKFDYDESELESDQSVQLPEERY